MRRLSAASLCLLLAALPSTASAIVGPSAAHHARGTENVFWFLHISDVHIGSPLYGDHTAHAQLIFDEVIGVVDPWFVAVTGDLVDGAKSSIPTLGQVQSEWDGYRALYEGAGMTPSFYFDLPGNHDGYGDVGMNFYRANSLLGRTHNRLYTAWTVEIPAGKYLFFGLNSAGNGSGSFFEQPAFTTDEIEVLQQTLNDHDASRLAVLLGHHPLSGPDNGAEVASMLSTAGGGYYLHGHTHEYEEYLAGDGSIVVNQIDSLAAKDERNIGVGVIDHDGFIYRATDTKDPWPLVMVTAPMGIDLRDGGDHPYAYDVCKDRDDNPVRAAVFSLQAPTDVSAQVGTAPAVPMVPSASSPNLWTADVDTTELAAGVHDVTVTATVDGQTSFHKIRARFVDGPCDALPEDPPPPPVPDAGVDAEPEGGSGGEGGEAGAAGSPGLGGAGGAGGAGGSSAAGGTGGMGVDGGESGSAGTAGDDGSLSQSDEGSDDGGCACASAGRGTTSWAALALVLASLLGSARRRRRSR